MSTVIAHSSAHIAAIPVSKVERIPWHSWASALAAACIASGLYWDICWHETIGRDTFWTPAHLLVQFGAVLAGLSCAYLIFSISFGKDRMAKEATVNVLGFRAPLGAFIVAWGAVTMITSAPFDNWWHNAYGLDVKIISPPHTMLVIGIAGIMWGSIILILGEMNRATLALRQRLLRLLLITGGSMIIMDMMFKLEYTNRAIMHSAIFYLAVSLGLGVVLEGIGRASGYRWTRTAITGLYTIFFLLALWIIPLFPAEPKLGPVYQHVTHMLSLPFPILILVPAFVLDLIFPRIQSMGKWTQAAIEGIVFVAVLLAVMWPFGTFLHSQAARNWVFGTLQFAYFLPPTAPNIRNVFVDFEPTRIRFLTNLGLAFLGAIVSTRIGITWGNFLGRVRR